MDCHALLQGIFPTQGSNLCLLSLLHWQLGSLPPVSPGKPHMNVYGLSFISLISPLENAGLRALGRIELASWVTSRDKESRQG